MPDAKEIPEEPLEGWKWIATLCIAHEKTSSHFDVASVGVDSWPWKSLASSALVLFASPMLDKLYGGGHGAPLSWFSGH